MIKKVLFIYPDLHIGGSTTSLISLLNELDYSMVNVDLLLYRNVGEGIEKIPDEVNILQEAAKYREGYIINTKIRKILFSLISFNLFKTIYYVIKKYGKNSRNLMRMALMQTGAYEQVKLSNSLNNEYDIAISFVELWANAYLVNSVKAKKKIAWIHVDYEKARFVPELDRENLEKVDKIVCVSEACLNNFIQSFPTLNLKTLFIENILSKEYVVNRSREENHIQKELFTNDRFTIITVCRLSIYTKGLDRIVKVVKQLKLNGNIFRWYIIGDGTDREILHDLIKNEGIEEYLVLLGEKTNPYPFIVQSDLFVLGSRHEGKPMVITEAQMLEVPTIVTSYASAHEQVESDFNGIIVANEDKSLVAAIERVIKYPDLLEFFRYNLKLKDFSNSDKLKQINDLLEI